MYGGHCCILNKRTNKRRFHVDLRLRRLYRDAEEDEDDDEDEDEDEDEEGASPPLKRDRPPSITSL